MKVKLKKDQSISRAQYFALVVDDVFEREGRNEQSLAFLVSYGTPLVGERDALKIIENATE
jgi:hypothetical protein